MSATGKCYLCGSGNELTRDHVPPKNLFRIPLPENLMTVPCCATCNNAYSKIEEQFRIFVSSPVNRSLDGQWIWKNKVVDSSFRRSPKLKQQIGKNLLVGNLKHPLGETQLPLMTIDSDLANKCLIKITRGLLSFFYPDIDHSNLEFGVFALNQFKISPDYFRSSNVPYIYDERGNGQFRFYRALVTDDNRCGHWILIFYDAAAFVVYHDYQGKMMQFSEEIQIKEAIDKGKEDIKMGKVKPHAEVEEVFNKWMQR